MFGRGRHETLGSLADEELMRLVRDGDPRAFEVVFERHVDAAFSLANRMCGRRAMAEDVVQEAFSVAVARQRRGWVTTDQGFARAAET